MLIMLLFMPIVLVLLVGAPALFLYAILGVWLVIDILRTVDKF